MPKPVEIPKPETNDEDEVFAEYGITDDDAKQGVRVNAAARDLALRRAERRRAKAEAEQPPKKKYW